jgi:hypothetical protein
MRREEDEEKEKEKRKEKAFRNGGCGHGVA